MLNEVIISITNRCNLKCRMCDIPLRKTPELDTADWKKAIDGISRAGANAVVFSGGEPLLRGDLYELIRYSRKRGLGVCLTSNGMAVDEEVAAELKEAGAGVVNISVEGPRDIHDSLRGKGSYDRACAALGRLRDAGVETTIAMMVSGLNYYFMDHAADLARDFGSTTVKYQPFSTLFLDPQTDVSAFFLSADKREECVARVERAYTLLMERGINTNPRQYLERIPEYLTGKGRLPHTPCPALLTSCPVTSDGSIYPCWSLAVPGMRIGRLTEQSFDRIWDSRRRLRILRELDRTGCPGCVMSCYDAGFGQETLRAWLTLRLNRCRTNGFRRTVVSSLKRLVARFNFYRSYRGTYKALARRFGGLFRRRPDSQPSASECASADIAAAKRFLEGELKSCRKA